MKSLPSIVLLGLSLSAPLLGSPPMAAPQSDKTIVARPFALADVKLLESAFHKAMEINRAYLLRLDADRFLWAFHYGAWAKKDIVGQVSGH